MAPKKKTKKVAIKPLKEIMGPKTMGRGMMGVGRPPMGMPPPPMNIPKISKKEKGPKKPKKV